MPFALKSKLTKYRGLLFLILTALLLRIIYIWQAADEAWFISPGMDPEFYTNWATAILQGHGERYMPFPRAPLFPYLLAGLMRLFGDGWIVPRYWNLIAETSTLCLIYFTAQQLFSKRSALIATALYAFSGAAIYFSGEVLMTSTACTLMAATGWLVVTIINKNCLYIAIAAGVTVALLSLLRPNALLLFPTLILILLLLTKTRNTTLTHSALRSTAIIIAGFFTLLPAIQANHRHSSSFIPISTQGGVNFYIGNAQGATGWSSTLPKSDAMWTDADAISLAEEYSKQSLNTAEVSSTFYSMSFAEISADRSAWFELMLKKALLLVSLREIGNNRPLELAMTAAPQMVVLFWISLGLLFPFLLVGGWQNRHKPEVVALIILSLIYAASIIIFFVNTRYRMPLLPLVAPITAAGIDYFIYQHFKNPRAIIVLVAGCLCTLPYLFSREFDGKAQSKLVAGNAWLRQGNYQKAIEEFTDGIEIDDRFQNLHLNLGVAQMALGDTIAAQRSFINELEHNQSNADAWNNLGVIAERHRDIEKAIQSYRSALNTTPGHLDAASNLKRIYVNVANTAITAGDYLSADSLCSVAIADFPKDAELHFMYAAIKMSRGDSEAAYTLIQKVMRLRPDYPEARQALEYLERSR